MENMWSVVNSQHLNITNIFSYEIVASFHFQMCSLYSTLFYSSILSNASNSKQSKTLVEMIEQFGLNGSSSGDENPPLNVVRLRFVNNLMRDAQLVQICHKQLTNFHAKLINFLIYSYVSNSTASLDTNPMSNSSSNSIGETELNEFANHVVDKVKPFNDLKIKTNSNLEQIISDFIYKFSLRLKEIPVLFSFSFLFVKSSHI